jgi:hypothetical protein
LSYTTDIRETENVKFDEGRQLSTALKIATLEPSALRIKDGAIRSITTTLLSPLTTTFATESDSLQIIDTAFENQKSSELVVAIANTLPALGQADIGKVEVSPDTVNAQQINTLFKTTNNESVGFSIFDHGLPLTEVFQIPVIETMAMKLPAITTADTLTMEYNTNTSDLTLQSLKNENIYRTTTISTMDM